MALVTVFSGSAVGYLYGKYGPSNVFLVISLIQLSALFLAIYLPKTEKNDSVSENYIDEMKKSFKYLLGNKMVFSNTFFIFNSKHDCNACTTSITNNSKEAMYMISPGEIGILLTLAGIGAVFGTLMISTLKKK